MLGKTMHVLVEESCEGTDGHLAGFTENYLRVLMDVPDSAVNRILPVKLTALEGGVYPGENSQRLSHRYRLTLETTVFNSHL